MTKPDNYLLDYMEQATRAMLETARKKNNDYAGEKASKSPFHNFAAVELMGITSTERGILTRMLDKFARITTFVQTGVLLVQDEKVEDTLHDLANYSLILAAYIKHKKENNKEQTTGATNENHADRLTEK